MVIANCGTVNTGAIDDLPAIAALCRKHDLWFHVDGAFGALLRLTKEYAGLVRGIEEADSLAFDLHKWVYLPFEIGCVLVRDPKLHTATFATQASYLEEAEGGIMAGGLPFADRGVELTRGFRALKLWMSLQVHGVDAYARLIAQKHGPGGASAGARSRLRRGLNCVAPRPTNVVCFRYRRPELDESALDALNRRLVIELQESGRYIVSSTVLDGRYALRVAITNHRSRMEDFTALAEDCVRFGDQLAASRMNTREELKRNLAQVEETIDAACRRSGRSRSEITLIAVTKMHPAAAIAAAAELGITHIGENKVQEFDSASSRNGMLCAAAHPAALTPDRASAIEQGRARRRAL